jgi:hypothetical protein
MRDLFERAVAEEGYRQEFVDAIARPEYVSWIDYDSEQKRRMFTVTAMGTQPDPLSNAGYEGYPAGIIVYPVAFRLSCLDDFLSLLEDHEFYHAKELYETPERMILPDILYFVSDDGEEYEADEEELERYNLITWHSGELRARLNQIEGFKVRNCSEHRRTVVKEKIEEYLDALNDLGVDNLAELIAPFEWADLS